MNMLARCIADSSARAAMNDGLAQLMFRYFGHIERADSDKEGTADYIKARFLAWAKAIQQKSNRVVLMVDF